jgi:hypothetical protein
MNVERGRMNKRKRRERRRVILHPSAFILLSAITLNAAAQTFPTKPLRAGAWLVA